MRLNYIELYGFKSFADKVRLKIDTDISAIVGPNGSGKSNISDAVRWALGEQSAKSLRGSKMEDVIFSGTEKKPEMNMAQVSLSLDNKDKSIDLPYEEVVVTRRVYRSGESDYLINKSSVRLKDVKSLFMDTGIGKDGYSIIGQGRIDSILSSKSEERREIFEEASGISKFKYEKLDAEKKLLKNEENLKDILALHKVKKQELDLLEKQAQNAEKAVNYIKKLEILELAELKANLSKLDSEELKLKANLARLESEKEDKLETYTFLKNKLSPYQTKIQELESLLEEKKNILSNLDKKDMEMRSKIDVLTSKNEYGQREIERLEENIKNKDQKSYKLKDLYLKDVKSQKENLKKLKLLQDDLHVYEEKASQLESTLEKNKSEYENISRERNRIKSKFDEFNIRYSTQVELKKNYSLLEEEENKFKEEIKSKLAKLELEKEEITSSIEKIEKVGNDLNSKLRKKSGEVDAVYEKLEKDTKECEDLEREIYKLDSKKNILENIYENFEGYYKPVQDFLRLAKRDEKIKSRFKGVLADLIKVEDKYKTAIDIAFGSALQNIVVNDEEDGKFLIQYIKQRKLGRITFLPISRIKASPKQKPVGKALANATDVLTYPEYLDKIIKHFLAKTLIVENLNEAVYTSNLAKSARVISLEGDVVNSWGSMVGGVNNKRGSTLLNRRKELDEIVDLISDKKNIYKELYTRIKDLKNKALSLGEEKKSLEIFIKEKYSELELKKRTLDKIDFEISSLDERLKEKKESRSITDQDLDLIHEKLQALSSSYETINKSYEKGLENIDKNTKASIQLEKSILDKKNQIEIVNRDIKLLENKTIQYQEDLENSSREKNLNLSLLGDEKSKLESNLKEIDKIKDEIKGFDIESKNLELEIENLTEKLKKEKSYLGEDQVNLDKLKNSLADLDKEIYQYNFQCENIKDKRKNNLDNYMDENQISMEDLTYKLDTLTDVDYTKREILSIKQELNKIGYFDISSIEEYKIESEIFENIEGQVEDLKKTREDIKIMIRDLERDMRTMFKNSFKSINERFSKIFKNLFNGGQAEIVLDGANLLDSGIDIIAQPPGKKLKNLALLSGGEKSLTAIALLFSIFETRPAPFCILDEIDAALDEANINRYKTYLKSLTKDTQFIIITHRKTTMEMADILYGVTMQEQGISKMITLNLENYEED